MPHAAGRLHLRPAQPRAILKEQTRLRTSEASQLLRSPSNAHAHELIDVPPTQAKDPVKQRSLELIPAEK